MSLSEAHGSVGSATAWQKSPRLTESSSLSGHVSKKPAHCPVSRLSEHHVTQLSGKTLNLIHCDHSYQAFRWGSQRPFQPSALRMEARGGSQLLRSLCNETQFAMNLCKRFRVCWGGRTYFLLQWEQCLCPAGSPVQPWVLRYLQRQRPGFSLNVKSSVKIRAETGVQRTWYWKRSAVQLYDVERELLAGGRFPITAVPHPDTQLGKLIRHQHQQLKYR